MAARQESNRSTLSVPSKDDLRGSETGTTDERPRIWSQMSSSDSNLPHRNLRSGSHLSEASFDRQDRPLHRQTTHAGTLEMANFSDESRGASVATLPNPSRDSVRPKRHSWAGSLKNWIVGLPVASSEGGSLDDLDMQLEVNEVAVVEAEKEWCGGCDLSSDSSSSEMGGWRQNRNRRCLDPATEAGDRQEVPVHVVEVEKEWGGADSDSEEDGASSIAKAGEERRRKLAEREARAAAASQTFSMRPKEEAAPSPPEVPVTPESSGRRSSVAQQRRTSRRIQKSRSFVRRDLMKRCWGAVVGWYGGFLAFSLLHFADCVLRVYSIYLYATYGLHIVAYAMLTPIQVIGAMLSIYITFHDADVLLIMHNSSTTMQKFFFFTVSLLFLGCCQLIQVKRAWSRQLHSPEVVLDMDDTKAKEAEDRASDASSLPDFGAAERITPVGLITGVPFLLVHWVSSSRYVEAAAAADHKPIFWWITAVVLLLTVSLGIVDIDFSVSSYVVRHYQETHQDCSMDSTVASVSDLYSEGESVSVSSPCTKTLDLDTDDCASVPVFIQSGAENVAVRSSAVLEAVSRSPLSSQCHGGVEQNILQFLNANNPDLFVEGWDGLFIWPEDIPRVRPVRPGLSVPTGRKATLLSL